LALMDSEPAFPKTSLCTTSLKALSTTSYPVFDSLTSVGDKKGIRSCVMLRGTAWDDADCLKVEKLVAAMVEAIVTRRDEDAHTLI
jgi:hypothetical protein